MANAPAPAPQQPASSSVDSDDAAWAALSGGASGGKGGAANGGANGGAPPAAANDDDAAWQALGGSKPGPSAPSSSSASTAQPSPVVYDAAEFKRRVGRDPAPAELANFAQFKGRGWANENGAPPPGPPSFVADAATDIGAGGKRMGASVQEGYGSSVYDSNLKAFWQALILPTAVREAQKNNISLTDDQGVIDAAKLLGIRPDQFSRDWPTYVNMSAGDLQKTMDDAKAGMAAGVVNKQAGASKREAAGEIEQQVAARYKDKPIENFALNAATMAPELIGGLGLSMIPGGQIPAAALLYTDFSLRAYSSGRDAGLNDQQAKLYGALSGVAAVVPEVPVMSVLSKTPAANAILESAFGKVVANSAASKVASVANSQGLAMATQQALQIAIDKGVINKNTSLPDALREIGQAYLTGTVIGVPVGAAHVGAHRLANGPAPKRGAAPTSAGAPEATNAPSSGAPEAANAPLPPVAEADRQAALARAAQTGGLLQDAEHEEALGPNAQEREIAQRNAEDHFEPLAAVDQAVAPGHRAVTEAGPANAIEHGQRDAAAHVAAQGGDALSQVVAATHVGAVLGGIHDAAAVQGARESEQASRETQRQAALDEWDKAWNAEPAGRSNEPALPPRTLAPALTPEQLQAFQTLKDRRNAVVAKPAAENTKAAEPQSEPTAAETPSPAAAPPNRLAAIRAAVEKRARAAEPTTAAEAPETASATMKASAAEPVGEEALPEKGPPPATVRTLADRRQAAVDAAMAEKVGRKPTGEENASANARDGRDADISPLGRHQTTGAQSEEPPLPRLRGSGDQNAPGVGGKFRDLSERRAAEAEPAAHAGSEGQQRPLRAGERPLGDKARAAEQPAREPMVGVPREAANRGAVGEGAGPVEGRNTLPTGQNETASGGGAERAQGLSKPMVGVPREATDVGAVGERAGPAERHDLTAVGPGEAARGAGAEPAQGLRKTLTIADRRAERPFVDEQKNRFADSNAARPEEVAYTRNPNGTHVAESPNGKTVFEQRPDGGNLQVKEPNTLAARRGSNEGTARIERGAMEAHADGVKLESGAEVSAPAARTYQKLADRGYDVKTNPHSVDPGSGVRKSASDLRGVYEVGPKRDPATENGLALRRRAAAGDQSAQDELGRRQSLANEPRTPEQAQGALAAKREATPAHDTQQPGERRGPAITKEEATQRLQPLIDKVGADKLHVHDSLNDPEVPQNVRDDAARFNHPDPRAAFDPKTGALHVFAGAGGHPDLESLHDTAVHEMAHKGVRNFLGKDYADTLQSVFDNIHDGAGALRSPIDGVRKVSAREWMEDYLSQHAMDPKNPEHQQIAADEYVASIAEHDANDPQQRNPSILRRVIDAVRAGLRKVGVVHEWTDGDIRRLLRESNNNPESPHARAAMEDFGNGIRWADSADRSVERLPPDDPRAIAAKYQRALADSANYNPGYVKSRIDALARLKDFLPDWADHAWEQAKDGGRKLWLYSIPLDKLPDHVNPDLNPSVRGYVRMVRRMNGRIGEQMAAAHEIYKPWNEFAQREPERAASLDDLMHESTLAGADPSKPFATRFTDEQRARSPKKTAADAARKARYDEMRPRFEALGDEGQKIYRDVRDAYKQQRADHDAALEQRMKDLGMSDAGRKQVMSLLQRDTHESGRVPEPYFPLARWGDRYAVAKLAGTDEVHSYSRFETTRQQKQWADAMRAEGHDVTVGRDTGGSNKAASHGVDPAFLHKVLELTKDFEPKESSEDGASSISDEIYQHYLSSLPDRSYRKMFMHRTGRLGFAGNARRAFADQSIRHAKAVASIEYGHRLDAMLENVNAEQKKIAQLASSNPGNRYLQREAAWAPDVRNELQNRHNAIRNPGSSKFVNALTGFGFHYYLGFNPATAARIHTQQYINALPWLGARHGWGPAANALKTNMSQYVSSKGNFGDVLRGDKRRAWDELNDNGTFMNTQAQSLTSASRGDALQRSGTSNSAKWAARANYASTFMFNGIEHFNRETTAMAAYDLARAEGKPHGEAVEHAMMASDTTHFDYSPANRPRILQGQAGKVGGLFAQYSVHQAYRILRDARDGMLGNRNIAPEERRARLGTLAGMIGMSALIAGAGTVASPVFGAINLAVNAGSDEPAFDSKAATHSYLVQHLGSKFLADMIMSGPISAATGASLGSTGLWDVFHRESSGDTAHQNWYTRIAPYVPVFGSMLQGGPLGELGQDLYTAANDLRAGNTERAVEHLLPMGFRGVPKALRHAFYGEQSPSALPGIENAQTAPKSEFGIRAFLSQLANFTPLSLADRREENAAKEAAVQSISGSPGTGGPRAQLLHQAGQAVVKDDGKALDAVIAQIQKFNAANPGLAIDSDTIEKSVNAQMQNAQQQVHGVTIPKGMRDRLQQLYSQDLAPPDTPGDTTGATAQANENP